MSRRKNKVDVGHGHGHERTPGTGTHAGTGTKNIRAWVRKTVGHGRGFAVLLLCAFALNVSLYAQVIDSEVRAARSYFEAKNYSRASAGYESLIDEILPSWQQAILLYNSGTAFLAEGRWEEALRRFDRASRAASAMPLVNQRLKSNQALALLMLAKTRMEELTTDEAYQQQIVLLRQVLIEIDSAVSAWCGLADAEGTRDCPHSLALEEIRLEAKRLFAKLAADYYAYLLEHLTMQEGISALVAVETSLEKEFVFLQDPQLDVNLKEKHAAHFLAQANSWIPLWENLQKKVEEKEEALFIQAKKSYLESLAEIKDGNYQSGLKALNKSQEALTKLLPLVFTGRPLEDSVQRLMISYGLALIRDPLQESGLLAVAEAQEALADTLPDSFVEDYSKAQAYLKKGQAAMDQLYPAKARLFAEAAYFFIKGIAEQIDVSVKRGAEPVLESAIAKQEFALLFSRLRQQVEEQDSDLDALSTEIQQAALNAADRFFPSVLNQQEISFASESRCQCHPWDEVIPLFSEGYALARRSKDLLQEDSVSAAVPLQEATVKRWKEALEKMRSAIVEEKPLEEKEIPELEERRQKEEELRDIVRLIQEMEADDQQIRGQPMRAPDAKEEERPW